MDRAEALMRLRADEAALRALGVEQLSLFGSTARGDQREDSDIDVAAVLNDAMRIGAFQFIRMEARIATTLGVNVDLVTEPSEMPRLQAEIDRDRLRVF